MEQPFGTGAIKSPYDIRTFAYQPTTANIKGGERYKPEDIEHQHKVGICTAISMTQNARKTLGIKFSAEFQYLCQKKFYDNPIYPNWQWGEGSSAFHALKVGKNIGFLPEEHWTFTTEQDRFLPYHEYIEKLKAVPEAEIERLKEIASKYKLKAYAKVVVDRDLMAQAIDESRAGIITRYSIGSEWWIPPIQPLRAPRNPVSGHLVTDSNYDGNSFRIANSWGADWADNGTAYRLQGEYRPTEAWIPYYNDIPKEVEKKLDNRTAIYGQILDLIQKIIDLLPKLV